MIARHFAALVDPEQARAEPKWWERLEVHLLYLAGFGLVASAAAVMLGDGEGIGAEGFNGVMGMAFVCAVPLFWQGFWREPPLALWVLSHLYWLTMSFVGLALGLALALAALILGAMSSAALPATAGQALLLAPTGIAYGFAAWLVYRLVRGYHALLKGAAVGKVFARVASTERG